MGRFDLDDDWYESQTYTYEELGKEVKEEWEHMSEDEKHIRNIQGDPTLMQFVLSSMKPGQSAELNEYTGEYKII